MVTHSLTLDLKTATQGVESNVLCSARGVSGLLDSTGQNRKMLELKTQVERKRRKCKVKNKIVATRGGGMTA